MARKKRRSAPKVPRSRLTPQGEPQVTESETSPEVPVAPAASEEVLNKNYDYVRSDLLRIALFGTLIFVGMIALRVVGF